MNNFILKLSAHGKRTQVSVFLNKINPLRGSILAVHPNTAETLNKSEFP